MFGHRAALLVVTVPEQHTEITSNIRPQIM